MIIILLLNIKMFYIITIIILILFTLLTNSFTSYPLILKHNTIMYNNIQKTIKCNICFNNIELKGKIPEDCILPLGCPYNIKTFKNNTKYIFKG